MFLSLAGAVGDPVQVQTPSARARADIERRALSALGPELTFAEVAATVSARRLVSLQILHDMKPSSIQKQTFNGKDVQYFAQPSNAWSSVQSGRRRRISKPHRRQYHSPLLQQQCDEPKLPSSYPVSDVYACLPVHQPPQLKPLWTLAQKQEDERRGRS